MIKKSLAKKLEKFITKVKSERDKSLMKSHLHQKVPGPQNLILIVDKKSPDHKKSTLS